jgi:predicted DNA-binding protein YlxM (UPF0122 family)
MEAVELKLQGHTHREIADSLRVSPTTVAQLIKEGLAELRDLSREATEDLILMQNARLEHLYKQLQERIAEGSTRAIETAIKVLERQAKLHGLDAPEKKQVDVRLSELPDDELLEHAKRAGVSLNLLEGANAALPGEKTAIPAAITSSLNVIDVEYTESPPAAENSAGD